MESRRLGRLLAALGGVILLLAALLGLLALVVSGILDRPGFDVYVAGTSRAVLEIVLGLIILVFGLAGGGRSGEMRVAGGVVLIVVAIVTWLIVGTSLLPLLGGLFALLGGIVILLAGR